MIRICILIPGFGYPSPAIGPYEVFASAGRLWQELMGEEEGFSVFDICTASIDGKPVEFLGGVTVTPDKAIHQIRSTDLVFIPSLGLDLDAALKHNRAMLKFLQRQAERGVWIVGVCTGVALLAEAGLLDGRHATTHWALQEVYQQRFPEVKWNTDQFISEDENIVCGGGVYAALDVSLYMVEKLAGYHIAKQCGRSLLIDTPRTWQASFRVPLLNQQHEDEKIKQAQEYMHEYFNTAFNFDELAGHIGMSQRNFARRFKSAVGETPLNYLHKLRINRAKQLLETRSKPVQNICYEVGYEDIAFFRNVFKRYVGLTPKDYQQRFGVQIPLIKSI